MRPALAGFRDKVTEMTERGLPLGAVERAIYAQPALTEDQKAALWVFAFSLRDRSGKRRQAQTLLAAAWEAPFAASANERARPQEFDARGFPVPQRNPRFLERVARLLNPD